MTHTPERALEQLTSAIEPSSAAHHQAAQKILDGKTKPRGSLGRLEEIACRICAVQGTTQPDVGAKVMVIMAADHGVASEGVSAYPQEVTGQMLLNFSSGGAAINVLARQAGADIMVVDMGVATEVNAPGIRNEKVARGTKNLRTGPAMSRDEAITALMTGARIAGELQSAGAKVIGVGEMGIANTTASSALASALTGVDPEELTGRGTGIDDKTHALKLQVIHDALKLCSGTEHDTVSYLARLGGFEIAGMAGLMLGGAARRLTIVVDGFISSVAAMVAVRLAPAARDYLIMSHQSVEAGHPAVWNDLGNRPLLDLGMRLGEGSGAALAMGLLDAAVAVLAEMASFDDAGVTDTGK